MEINRFYVQVLKYVLCVYVCEGVTNCFGAFQAMILTVGMFIFTALSKDKCMFLETTVTILCKEIRTQAIIRGSCFSFTDYRLGAEYG